MLLVDTLIFLSFTLKTYNSHREFLKMSTFIHSVEILFYCSFAQESRLPESSQELEDVQMEDIHTEQTTTTISSATFEDHYSVIDRVNEDNFFKV